MLNMYRIMSIKAQGGNSMLNTISVTQARYRLLDLVRETETTREPLIITKGGRSKAVLLSANEFEEWIATLEIITHSKSLKSLRRGLRDLKSKRIHSFQEVFGEPLKPRHAKR